MVFSSPFEHYDIIVPGERCGPFALVSIIVSKMQEDQINATQMFICHYVHMFFVYLKIYFCKLLSLVFFTTLNQYNIFSTL